MSQQDKDGELTRNFIDEFLPPSAPHRLRERQDTLNVPLVGERNQMMTLMNRIKRLERQFAMSAAKRSDGYYALLNRVGRAAYDSLSDADARLLHYAFKRDSNLSPEGLSPEEQAAKHRADAACEAFALKLTGLPFSELKRKAGFAEGSRGPTSRGRKLPQEPERGSRN